MIQSMHDKINNMMRCIHGGELGLGHAELLRRRNNYAAVIRN